MSLCSCVRRRVSSRRRVSRRLRRCLAARVYVGRRRSDVAWYSEGGCSLSARRGRGASRRWRPGGATSTPSTRWWCADVLEAPPRDARTPQKQERTPAANVRHVRLAQLLRRVRHLRALLQVPLDVVQQPLGAEFQVDGLLRQLVDARAGRPGPVGRHERLGQYGEGQQPPHAAGEHSSLSRRAVSGSAFKLWAGLRWLGPG